MTALWTVDDLFALPDDGNRYEIFDGSLLVSPPSAMPHISTTYRLRRLLERQAPPEFAVVVEGVGMYRTQTNYFIPDLLVFGEEVLKGEGRGVSPDDALLAVEVVSPSNAGNDTVLKRHAYAVMGVREYWIVDERDRTLRVLMPDELAKYAERAVVHPGEAWRSDEPFPLMVDPGEIF